MWETNTVIKTYLRTLVCECGGFFQEEIDKETNLCKCNSCGKEEILNSYDIPTYTWEYQRKS